MGTEIKFAQYQDEYGEEADTLEMGKAVASMLSQRHYKWVNNKKMLLSTISEFFPTLPIDTVENNYRAVTKIRYMAKQTSLLLKEDDVTFATDATWQRV